MWIRMKAKYFTGLNNNKRLVPDDPALTGCFKDKERQALKDKLERREIAKEQYEECLRNLLVGVKGKGKVNKKEKRESKRIQESGREEDAKKEGASGDNNQEDDKKEGKGKRKGEERIPREASSILQLELQHGDLLVMHGANLQRYYEVTPSLRIDRYHIVLTIYHSIRSKGIISFALP